MLTEARVAKVTVQDEQFDVPVYPLPQDFSHLDHAGLTSLDRIATQEAGRLRLPPEAVKAAYYQVYDPPVQPELAPPHDTSFAFQCIDLAEETFRRLMA